MADTSSPTQTIKDLITGFNQFQAQLGLTPLTPTNAGFNGGMTPMPQTKHPGEFAAEIASQMNQRMRQAAEAHAATSMYAQDFGQRIAQVQANYLSPQTANMMARTSGQQGFSNMPNPVYQTDPTMGIFRPTFAPPPNFLTPPMVPSIPRPYMPLFGTGALNLGNLPGMGMFAGTPPPSQFSNPYERNILQQQLQNTQNFAAGMARVPTIADTLATVTSMLGGMGTGAALGSRMGPWGALAGGVAGAAGGYAFGAGLAGPAAGRFAESTITRPLMETRAYGEQLMNLTRDFVVQGSQVSPLGRGLTQQSSVQLAGNLQRGVEQGQMGGFNMRDVMKVTGMAADQGMLDMAQSGDQIASQVRNVARGLQNFMRIAQEPDVQRAMQMMGSMRAMGLSIPESTVAMQHAKTFAQMAGTSVPSIMQGAGLPGAMTFQQMGLTAGLGMQVGMGAAGLSRQAIAGGAFNPAQLALAGGMSGLQQTLTESSGAALGVNFQTMAMLSRNNQGQLSVDPERLKSVMSGHVSLSQQAAMAADNISRLAQQGGVSPENVLSEFRSRTNELRDEMGRRLGPMGGNMLLMRQAMNLQQELGGNIGLGSALSMVAPGLSTNQVRSLELAGPGMFRGAQQHLLSQIPEIRQKEMARLEAQESRGGWRGALRDSWAGRGARAVGESIDRTGDRLSEMRENVAGWWSDTFGGSNVDPVTGAEITRTPAAFEMSSQRQTDTLRRWMGTDAYKRETQRNGHVLRGRSREPTGELTSGQLTSSIYGGARAAAMFGGGFGVSLAAGMLTPEATGAASSDIVRAVQIAGGGGGLGGYLEELSAEHTPWLTNLISQVADPADVQGRISAAKSVMTVSQQLKEGMRITDTGRKAIRKQLAENYGAVAKQEGAEAKDYSDIEDIAVTATVKLLDSSSGWTGNHLQTEEAIKKAVIQRLVDKGTPRAVAERTVNTNWKAGMSQIVLRRAYEEGTPKSTANLSKLLNEKGFQGLESDFRKNREEYESQTSQLIAGKETWFGIENRITDKAAEEYGEFAIEASPEEMLMRQATALRAQGGEENIEAADRIMSDLKGQMKDSGKYNALMKKVLATPASESLQKTLAIAAEKSGQVGAKERLDAATDIQTRSRFKKTETAIGKGVKRQAEQEGVSEDVVRQRMDSATKEGSAYRQKMFAKGLTEGSAMQTGGKGAGSTEEGEVRDQAAAMGAFADSIAGFKTAVGHLDEAASKIDNAMKAVALNLNHP